MRQFNLGPLSRLHSSESQGRPLLLQLKSVQISPSPQRIAVLQARVSDGSEESDCTIVGTAAGKVVAGEVAAGDIVSVTRTSSDGIEEMEKVGTADRSSSTGFRELEIAPRGQLVDVVVRVAAISEVASFHPPGNFGPRHFFNLALLDHRGSEAIASFFEDELTRFHAFFELSCIYQFTRFQIDANSKKATSHVRFSLTATKQSSAKLIEERVDFPIMAFHIVSFAEIKKLEKRITVDLAGVVTNISDFTARKRDITMVNDHNEKATVTLWGALAEADYDQYKGKMCILVVKRAEIYSPRGVVLRTVQGLSRLLFDVRGLEEVEKLQRWKDSRPSGTGEYIRLQSESTQLVPSSRAVTAKVLPLAAIMQDCQNTGWDHKYTALACIKQVNVTTVDSAMYSGCASVGCRKGVQMRDGMYHCEKCGTVSRECTYRYKLNLSLSDESDCVIPAIAFDKEGEFLLQQSAKQARRLWDEALLSLNALLGQRFIFTLVRQKRDLRASQGFVIEEVKRIDYCEIE